MLKIKIKNFKIISPQLIQNFRVYQRAIDRFLAHENWFVWANMEKGQKVISFISLFNFFKFNLDYNR